MEIEVGSVLQGKVSGITKFGAFVDLGEGKSGLVHVSQVANSFVEDIATVLKVGEQVKVKVLSIADDGKIALSIKACLPPAPRPQRQDQRPAFKKPRDLTYTYQPKPAPPAPQSFEEMMSRFKQNSDEKLGEFKRSKEVKGRKSPHKNKP